MVATSRPRHGGVAADEVEFARRPGRCVGNRSCRFGELVKQAYHRRASSSRRPASTRRPKIHWDRATRRGQPFYYFAYGAAVLGGRDRHADRRESLLRADILHDVGASLNPAIDIGQVEGGFIQGMGWLTTEELWWDDEGRLRTHAPSTYKIPRRDVPPVFQRRLLERAGPSRHDPPLQGRRASRR